MNRITNEEITNYLENQTEYLINKYPHQIMGTFVIGNANYGFANSLDEVYIVAIYVPTFEELCFSTPYHYYDKEKRIVIDDIRNCYTAERDIWKDYLELLNSDYYIISEPYEDLFKKMFLDKREMLGRTDPKARVQSMADRAIECYERKPLEAERLLLTAMEYSKGTDIYNCFHLDSNPAYDSYLWLVKDNKVSTNGNILKEKFSHILSEIEDKPNPKAAAAIKEGVISIIDKSLHNNISSDTFIFCLTDAEKQALNFIIKEINLEGNISISKMVESTKLSRPVYTNLLNKMKTHNVAEIVNQGVKGTKIKILDKRLLKYK